MSTGFVSDPHDVVSIGDKVQVRVKEIDNLGRINLSMLLDPAEDAKKLEKRSGGGGQRGGFRPRSGGFRSRGDRGGLRGFDRPRSSGPHFPASRLMDVEKKY
jgi:polyribonucleotide nucleotidyltransferase